MATATASKSTLNALAVQVAAGYGIAVGDTIATDGGYSRSSVLSIEMYRGEVRLEVERGQWTSSIRLSDVIYS